MGYTAIIDYGVGNLKSVSNALAYLGEPSEITRDARRLELADAIILPGVGAFPDAADKLRESGLEQILLRQAGNKPILGICRGHQVLNVALGGTLIQDLGPEGNLFHRRGLEQKDRIHPVRSASGSLFDALYGAVFPVNSSHHQALDQIGRGLTPVLWSESGVVEGLVHTSLPVFSVQFHPERMAFGHRRSDTVDGAPLFQHFMALCRESAHAG